MTIRMRHCTEEDLKLMNLEENLKPNFERYLELFSEYTATMEDELGVIFCCGFNFLWGINKGVAEAWIKLINKRDLVTMLAVINMSEKLLYEYIEKLNLWRIQATVRADDIQTLRFNKLMGFEEEARLSQFYPDKTDAIILKLKNKERK